MAIKVVNFIFNDGSVERLDVKDAVIREAKCLGQIEGGRPAFDEVKKPPGKPKAVREKVGGK